MNPEPYGVLIPATVDSEYGADKLNDFLMVFALVVLLVILSLPTLMQLATIFKDVEAKPRPERNPLSTAAASLKVSL